MRFADNSPNLSGLPQADSNRELQERSFLALRNALSPQDFVLRDERIEDAGVDVSLELLTQGRYTNLRSQVQVKSTSSPTDLANGTVSLQVSVHNLLYLLNGSNSPLYVLYIASRDELRFAWARDESVRLNRESPGWQQQGNVNLHFEELLNAQALLEIRQRIEREARFQSQVHEVLGRSSAGEIVRVCIEEGTLRSTDPSQQEQTILDQGITLSNAGRAAEVIEAASALNPAFLEKGRIQLVLGYAYYLQSHFTMAVAALSQAALVLDELSPDDRQFLASVRDTCDYYTGRISFEVFAERAKRWNQGSATGTSFSVGFRLDELRYQLHATADPSRPREAYDQIKARRDVVTQIRDYVQSLDDNEEIPPLLRLQAFTFWTHAEGTQMAVEDELRWSKANMRLKMKQDPKVEAVLQESVSAWARWDVLMENAIKNAREFGHPLPIADLLLNRALIRHLRLLNSQLLALIFRREQKAELGEIAQLQEQVKEAQNCYSQIQFLEGQLQCRLVVAQLQVMHGQIEEARREAQNILPIVQAMQYPLLEVQAQQILEGRTVLENAQSYALANSQEDEDERWARETDEGLRQFARQQLENLELPVERLPAMEKDAFSMRGVARQRLSWCRHIELIQDKTHTFNSETLYANDPFHVGRCQKFGFNLGFECTDWKIALSSFQHSVCRGCPCRSPKNTSGPS